MRALQRNLGGQHDFSLTARIAKENLAIANKCALLHFFLSAEPENLRPGAAGQFHAGGIVGVQDGKIVGLLILEDAGLGVSIGSKCAMAVQVVRGDVQHHGNLRTKCLDGFELKAGNFKHRDRVSSVVASTREIAGRADISSDHRARIRPPRQFLRSARWWWSCRSNL